MEMLILGILTCVSVVINAVLYRKYSNTKHYLFESEERVQDLEAIVSVLKLSVSESKPVHEKKKMSKPVKKSKAIKRDYYDDFAIKNGSMKHAAKRGRKPKQ